MKPSRFLLEEVTSRPQTEEIIPRVKGAGGKVHLKDNHTVPLYPIPLRVYRISIEYPVYGRNIGCEITVRSTRKSGQLIDIEFTKDSFFINGKTPQRTLDNLDIACSKIIYPVNLTLNYENNRRYLSNSSAIKERFKQNLPSLQKDYKGELLARYIRQIETSISQPMEFVRQLLSQDLFFALFTHPVHLSYSPAMEIDSQISIKLSGVDPLLTFIGKQKIEETYNTLGGFFIRFHGLSTPIGEVCYELNVEYNLNYADYTIKDIRAEIHTVSPNEREVLVRTTMHQLRKKEPPKNKRLENQEKQQKKRIQESVENEERYQKYLKSKRSWFEKLFDL